MGSSCKDEDEWNSASQMGQVNVVHEHQKLKVLASFILVLGQLVIESEDGRAIENSYFRVCRRAI